MIESIVAGGLEIQFLQSKDTTEGGLDMFEMIVQPNARMPVPHYHTDWDETIYALAGTTNFRIDGKTVVLNPGDTIFIKRGIVHAFSNDSQAPSKCLCVLTPGLLGPDYFREISAQLAGGAPDPAKMKEIMLRYGLVPVPAP